ncbi:Palmitoyltransferase [Aphelenchoides besseyi]|nr:Palmitoyltransferase [Aphelenchoides besseyi]
MEYQERMNSVNHVVRETRRYANRLQPQDIISIGCMAIILPIGYLIQIFFILSFWYETFSDSWYLRVVPLTYMGLNIYLNLWMLIRVGSNGNSAPLPTVMKPGFRYCHSCQLNAPPRTYHCPGLFVTNVSSAEITTVLLLLPALAISINATLWPGL